MSSTDYTLHVTFLFHCAFIRLPDRRRTDVLLAPGLPMPTNGSARDASDTAHNGHDHDRQPAPTEHEMEHIASLRIPEECIAEEGAGEPRGVAQTTVTLDRTVTDRTWRLEKYDVAIDVGNEARRENAPPASVGFRTTDGEGSPFVIADFAARSGLKVDEACTKDGDEFPAFLKKGARVRLWGGALQCGIPRGPLRDRLWDLGFAQPVGLSDRMEYRKQLDGGQVVLRFTSFQTNKQKIVRLKPNADGVVRLHISNDPFEHDLPTGSRETDPCGQLRHFGSYSLLLFPAGEDKSAKLRQPVPVPSETGTLIVSEGSSVCCPCGAPDGPP